MARDEAVDGDEAGMWLNDWVQLDHDRPIALADLLRLAAAHVEGKHGIEDGDNALIVDALLGGGVPAVRARVRGMAWLQYGLGLPAGARTALYVELASVVRQQLAAGLADEFFFMHKPPGLRVRFQTTTARRRELDAEVRSRLSVWLGGGMVREWRPGVYEPESYLFGGPRSMGSVHRIFTADSLAWLDFHRDPATGASWALSLLMVRGLLDAMRISDWEDLDVWNLLRDRFGRQLDPQLLPEASPALVPLRRAWREPARLWSSLKEGTARQALDEYLGAIGPICAAWRDEYFATASAHVGTREAAALLVAFHWNRADISAARQALIVAALADQTAV